MTPEAPGRGWAHLPQLHVVHQHPLPPGSRVCLLTHKRRCVQETGSDWQGEPGDRSCVCLAARCAGRLGRPGTAGASQPHTFRFRSGAGGRAFLPAKRTGHGHWGPRFACPSPRGGLSTGHESAGRGAQHSRSAASLSPPRLKTPPFPPHDTHGGRKAGGDSQGAIPISNHGGGVRTGEEGDAASAPPRPPNIPRPLPLSCSVLPKAPLTAARPGEGAVRCRANGRRRPSEGDPKPGLTAGVGAAAWAGAGGESGQNQEELRRLERRAQPRAVAGSGGASSSCGARLR